MSEFMKKKILLLRISYWTAAIADFSVAGLVLMPERMGLTEIAYPMGLASAIAFSWGILLLMADRKPLERRWILIPTIMVVALLLAARLVFVLYGGIEPGFALFIFGTALIILMAYSLYNANKSGS
jgi:hypothetical protein